MRLFGGLGLVLVMVVMMVRGIHGQEVHSSPAVRPGSASSSPNDCSADDVNSLDACNSLLLSLTRTTSHPDSDSDSDSDAANPYNLSIPKERSTECCSVLGLVKYDPAACLCKALSVNVNVLGLLNINLSRLNLLGSILSSCNLALPSDLACP